MAPTTHGFLEVVIRLKIRALCNVNNCDSSYPIAVCGEPSLQMLGERYAGVVFKAAGQKPNFCCLSEPKP